LEAARLEYSKLKLRSAIFGKSDLSKKELQLRSETLPKQIAKLEKRITRHKQRLEMLTVYKVTD
jgi:chaperonin cofactor prefoldin